MRARALLVIAVLGLGAAFGSCTDELAVPGDVYLGTFEFKVKQADGGDAGEDAALARCRSCPDGGDPGATFSRAPEDTVASLSMDSKEIDAGVNRFYFVVAGRAARTGTIAGDKFTLTAAVEQPIEECDCTVRVEETLQGFLVAGGAATDAGPVYQSAEATLLDVVSAAGVDGGEASCAADAGSCRCALPCRLEFEMTGTRR